MNTREETYHMTEKEMARLKVAERLLEGEVTTKDAAEVLEILSNVVDEKFYIPSKKSLCSHLLCQFSINKFLIFKYK